MHDRGIKIGLNIDPHEGIYPHEPKFAEIAALLNINDKSTIPFNVFDNTILNIYFNKLILPLYNVGVDFFWLDYYNPDDRVTMDALNYYHFNDYKRFTNQRGMILARNSRIAAHRYPVHYSGQTIVSWKTLSTLPYYNSTSSNIGLSWWSHDIGGYKDGIEDSELYVRYVQLGTFSPIFRFAAKYGHYYKREPWKWDVQTLNIVREYCVLRHKLIPYLYGEAYKYHKTGLPLIQPLYYNYPEIYDEPVYKNEYYFGTELFVAPITSKKDNVMGRAVERVFLPEGTWYDFKTGKKFPGNKRYVVFYKDEDYPVFAKSGSIIPLADLEENINNTNSPKAMEIHIFPGKSNIYNLYEDDGYSSLYKDGYYIVTRIDYNYLANNFTVIIRPVEGKSGIIPDKRDYRIRFRNTREADEVVVMLGKDAIPSTSYVEDNDFIVEVKAVPTTQQLTINCKGKNIEIDADIEDRCYIESDRDLLEIVWNNLLSNAIKFSETNGKIYISQKRIADKVEIVIEDEGCGMDEETLHHIFEKFYQGDTSHATEGNGLGLALTLRCLQMMNGCIRAESHKGKGSKFTVQLPIENQRKEAGI